MPTGRATARSSYSPRVQTVRSFYSHLIDEVSRAGYDASEQSLLAHPLHYYGRYLDSRSRDYVNRTVLPRVADGIEFLGVLERPGIRVVDVGCGLGMQSLILASLGASVIGIDVREESIVLCRKRQAYYERELGTRLDLEFRHEDFSTIRRANFGHRCDALFSMSAFSYIKPLHRAASNASRLLEDNARVFLYEQNALNALDGLKRTEPIPSPHDVAAVFEREGFRTELLQGAGSLPSFLWRVPALNATVLTPANESLRKNLRVSFAYVLGMQRGI
jgi:2-polyprenyl-3-methyl-5-hydroxy-6-metoxy-1,4-benzoquinol methylase